MIKHIVMLQLKENSEANQILLKEALEGLPSKIKEIKSFEVGINVIESSAAFDLVLVSTFESLETLEIYRVHPEHQKVVSMINELCSDRAVVDYQI